jgi:hypothetical protein
VLSYVTEAIAAGLADRKADKDTDLEEDDDVVAPTKKRASKLVVTDEEE